MTIETNLSDRTAELIMTLNSTDLPWIRQSARHSLTIWSSSSSIATASGLMNGYPNGTFAPERFVTRAEMAAIVSRWLSAGEQVGTSMGTAFPDIAGHWAQTQIARAEAAGIVTGLPGGMFQPDKTLTRAEAVVMLNRLLGRGPLQGMDEPHWKDVSASHWALQHIHEASVDHEFFLSDGGGERWFE